MRNRKEKKKKAGDGAFSFVLEGMQLKGYKKKNERMKKKMVWYRTEARVARADFFHWCGLGLQKRSPVGKDEVLSLFVRAWSKELKRENGGMSDRKGLCPALALFFPP